MAKKVIKIIPTKAGTAYSSTYAYQLLDYIVVDSVTVYICKRVDPNTMVNVGHPLTDTDWWDKGVDLSEAIGKAQVAIGKANAAANAALSAANNASESVTAANAAAKEALSASERANDTARHAPYVDSDGYYYRWNPDTKAYNKTDVNLTGKAFQIKKVFASVSAMNAADVNTFAENDFILINTSNVEDEDNAKLYVIAINNAGEKFYSYLVDMSGFRGFTGKTPQIVIGSVKTLPPSSSASSSLEANGTDTDGNPVYTLNFAIPKGDKITLADLTAEEIKQLQKPANDAISACNDATSKANTATSAANTATAKANAAADDATSKSIEADKLNSKVAADEEARVQAESVRVSSETVRKTNEDARIEAETERATAENARFDAETARENNEAKRKNAESSRVTEETARAESEKLRVAAEKARATAESTRAAAEAQRESDFATSKKACDDATAASKAQTAACKTATDNANDTASHPTKVGDDNYVYLWNKEQQIYEKTAIYVKGDKGEKGDKGDQGIQGIQGEKGKSPIIKNGTWWLWDEESNAYTDSGVSVSSDYMLTKEKVEDVLTGDITTHSHSKYALAVSLAEETQRAVQKESAIQSVVDIINGSSQVEGSFRKAIADLIGGAPEALDTLKEIADRLADNDTLHDAIQAAITLKADQTALDAAIKRITSLEGGSASTIEVIGTGNAITDISKSGTKITANKGGTFLTSHQDLSAYAKTSQIPTKVSQLANDSGYLTSHQSLDAYLTKSAAETAYQPKGNYLTAHQSLADYAKKTELPTKVSQLTNDSGYITSSASITGNAETSNYAKKLQTYKKDSTDTYGTDYPIYAQWVDSNTVSLKCDNYIVKTNYADSAGSANSVAWGNVSGRPTKLSQFTNDSGFITSHQSLAGYATESWVKGLRYVTDADVAAKYQPRGNYLTSHQDISGKSDKTHTHSVTINGVTKTIAATGGSPVDLGNYLTSHQSLADYAKKTDIPTVPTKTSQLVNDSNFITMDDLKCKITLKLKSTISDNDNALIGAAAIDISTQEGDFPTLEWFGDPLMLEFRAGGKVRISAEPVSGYITPMAVEFYPTAGLHKEITLTFIHLPIGVYIYDTDGRFTLPENWNSANNSKVVGV